MRSFPRTVKQIIEPRPVTEGAGVRLKRSIGTQSLDYLDPFLLLDHFASTDPRDYKAGFPLHPHRGIETVTYLLSGAVSHKDTLGNSATIAAGDVQWMTAGRGIMHEEMPQVRPEGIAGFQLWVNLPAKLKMTEPRHQNIEASEIPVIKKENGVTIRVITGEVDGARGPVSGIAIAPIYMDVWVPAKSTFVQKLEPAHTAFAYVFEGGAKFSVDDKREDRVIDHPKLVVFGEGDSINVMTTDNPVRFLLVSGEPLDEPVVRYGPFVMNTRQEIEQALADLQRGTFVR
jgi:quercetin 2,3-dioxygenase